VAFDVRTFSAAHEPWSFTDERGRVWQPTRELSAPAALRWLARIDLVQDELGNGHLNQTAALDRWLSVTRRIIRSLFPWHPRYWWSGDPSRAFDRLPLDARRAAIDALFRSRGLRTSSPPPPNPQTTQRPSSGNSQRIRTEPLRSGA
jgi:hypothetical protein